MSRWIKVYHLSPHANIQRFRGSYSPKMGARGIFVSESWESILDDWVDTLLSKRFGGRKPSTLEKRKRRLRKYLDTHEAEEETPEYQAKDAELSRSYRGADFGDYRSLTIYQILVPLEIFTACQQRMDQLAEEAFTRAGAAAIGAWGWGVETFLLEEFLPELQITGRQTYTARDAIQLSRSRRRYQQMRRNNIWRKMEQYRQEVEALIEIFGPAPLLDRARRYISQRGEHIHLERADRHYQIIEDLMAPYKRQLEEGL